MWVAVRTLEQNYRAKLFTEINEYEFNSISITRRIKLSRVCMHSASAGLIFIFVCPFWNLDTVASNAIQTIVNEKTHLINYCLNCIRRDENSKSKTGLNIPCIKANDCKRNWSVKLNTNIRICPPWIIALARLLVVWIQNFNFYHANTNIKNFT
jgi:hypothetical protein